MKKVKYPIHKMGKIYGYDLHEDGSISIARIYSEKIDNVHIKELAIEKTLKVVTVQCQELLNITQKEASDFWRQIQDDYELDTKFIWKYHYETKRLYPEIPEKKISQRGTS